MTIVRLATFLLLALFPALAQDWKAGIAKLPITPQRSLWAAGYAARKKPSEGALQPLYVKALALEDRARRRAVLVTADLLGFPADLAARIAARVEKQNGLARDRLMLNASHTHGGPVVGSTLRVAYEMTDQQWRDVEAYTRELEDKVVAAIDAALADLRSARLRFGRAQAGFAANRRLKLNPNGPVDHDVPVLRVEDARGALRGVVFGYACHNTTLGADIYEFHGDYAGYAQELLEQRHPRATALFVAGCGADANPAPRGTIENARRHGDTLAAAVEQLRPSSLRPVRGPLRSAFEQAPVAFAPPPARDHWQARLTDKNVYFQRHARMMLDLLDRDGRLPEQYSYPVQVWQLGGDLTWVALAGEVVVDYALRLKKELGPERLWVAGYSNDVFAYIPSRGVLEEGGYEGEGAMIYYGQPGRFAASVEETIVAKVHELVQRCRRNGR